MLKKGEIGQIYSLWRVAKDSHVKQDVHIDVDEAPAKERIPMEKTTAVMKRCLTTLDWKRALDLELEYMCSWNSIILGIFGYHKIRL